MELQLHKYQILGQISISSSCDDQWGTSRTLSQSIKYMTVKKMCPAELLYKNEGASIDIYIHPFYIFPFGNLYRPVWKHLHLCSHEQIDNFDDYIYPFESQHIFQNFVLMDP